MSYATPHRDTELYSVTLVWLTLTLLPYLDTTFCCARLFPTLPLKYYHYSSKIRHHVLFYPR